MSNKKIKSIILMKADGVKGQIEVPLDRVKFKELLGWKKVEEKIVIKEISDDSKVRKHIKNFI